MAWSRSSLAIAAIAGSILKAGVQARQSALAIVATVLLVALDGAVWAVEIRTDRGSDHGPRGVRRRRSVLMLMSGTAVFSAAVAFVFALAS